MLAYAHQFLANLSFSLIVESGVALLLYRAIWKTWSTQLVTAAIIGTTLTIPYVWFVFPTLLWEFPILIIVVGEVVAVCAETVLYRYLCALSWKQAATISIAANAASYLLGILLNAYIG